MSSPANPLLGKPQGELDQEDQLLSALSNLAYADPEPKLPTRAGRSSRFWFKVEDVHTAVASKKRKMAPKSVEYIDKEINNRLKTYESELSPVLKVKIDQVREFFLKEIAPLTLATAGGTIQSRAVAERMLETEVDPAIFARFENMVSRAATIKLGLFVLEYFGLPKTHFHELLGTPSKPSELDRILAELHSNTQQLKRMERYGLKSSSGPNKKDHK